MKKNKIINNPNKSKMTKTSKTFFRESEITKLILMQKESTEKKTERT